MLNNHKQQLCQLGVCYLVEHNGTPFLELTSSVGDFPLDLSPWDFSCGFLEKEELWVC